MKRFVEGADRGQGALFPECLDDWIGEDNPVRRAPRAALTTRGPFDFHWLYAQKLPHTDA